MTNATQTLILFLSAYLSAVHLFAGTSTDLAAREPSFTDEFACVAVTTVSEDFNSLASGSSTLPSCWVANSSNLFINTGFGVGGSNALTYFPSSDDTVDIVLPEISGISTKSIALNVSTGDGTSTGPSTGRLIIYQSASSDPADQSTNMVLSTIELASNAAFQGINVDLPLIANATNQGNYLRVGLVGFGASGSYVAIDNVSIIESTVVNDLNESFTGISNTPTPNIPEGWLSSGSVAVFNEYLQLVTVSSDAVVVTPGIVDLSEKLLSFTGRTESSGGTATIEVFVKDEASTDLTGLSPLTTVSIDGTNTQSFIINFKDLGVQDTDGNYVVFRLTSANSSGVQTNRLDDFLTINQTEVGLISKYSFTNNVRSDDLGNTGTLVNVLNDFGAGPVASTDRFGDSNNAVETGFDKYLYVPAPVVDLTQDFTLNQWFKLDGFGNEDAATLFDSRFRANRTEGGGLTLLAMKAGGISLFTYKSTGGFANTLTLSNLGTFQTGVWHMATVTRENNTIYVYLDGQLIGSGDPGAVENGAIWSLGGQNDTRPLRGSLDDVAFYDRALNAETLNTLFLENGFNKNRNPVDIILTSTPVPEDAPVGTVIGDFATVDADEGDTHTYEIVGTVTIPQITISGSQLLVNGELDAEGLNPFRFNVRSTDAAGLTVQKLVSFEILDVNEAPTDIAFKVGINSATTSSSFTTNENNAVGTILRQLLTLDPDEGDTHTYSLSGEDADSFSIGTDPGFPGDILLKAETVFDFEANPTYHFNIVTEDAAGLSFSKAYTMTVVDDNDTPTDILLAGTEETDTIYVDELNSIDGALATFVTVDQDASDTHQYEFVNSTASEPIFTINGDVLQADIVFNHEETEFYEVGIRTLDSEFEQTTKVFIVAVNDVNEAPTDLFFVGANPSFRAEIEENNTVGDLIATIGVSDPDADDSFTYEITGDGLEDFIIDGTEIRAARIFDHETEEKTTYTLSITVTDSEGLTYFELFNINILDVDEFGPNQEVAAFDFNGQNFTDPINGYVAEATQFNQNTGELLFPTPTTDRFGEADNALQFSPGRSIVMYDPILDLSQNFSLNLWFRMDASIPESGQFLMAHPSLSIGIDNQGTLFLQGANGMTQVFNFSTPNQLQTEEWYMLTIVADVDGNPDAVSLYINDAVANSATQQTINLASNNSWNFGGTGSNQFPFSGKIDDITFFQKALSSTEVIELYDIAEGNSAPTAITLNGTTIDENQGIGTIVGELSTTDADVDDTHTYSLSGTDAASFAINGNNLETAEIFDFETKSNYSIDITTTDALGASFTDSFTITVNDLTENSDPTDITLSSESVSESLSAGSLVGLLSTTDADAADSHSYSLSGADAASFSIGVPPASETQTLGLLTGEVFDFESKASYAIEITTNDGNGGTFTKSFTISVENENEAPLAITLSNNTISENEETGTFIGRFTTSDPDASDQHTITLGGVDANSFSVAQESNNAREGIMIQTSSYVLRSNEVFDFETKSSYTIEVTSTDAGSLSITQSFTITIEDVAGESNAPTDILLSSTSVEENLPVGTLVGTLSTIDPDAGDSHTYTLGGDQGSSFQLDGNNLLTAEVFDVTDRTSYEIEITANDGNGGIFTKSFIITIVAEENNVLSLADEIAVDFYPNPFKERLILEAPNSTDYQIVTLSGKVLRSDQINSGRAIVDLENIADGTYLLILRNGEAKRTEIIIKRQ